VNPSFRWDFEAFRWAAARELAKGRTGRRTRVNVGAIIIVTNVEGFAISTRTDQEYQRACIISVIRGARFELLGDKSYLILPNGPDLI
jgi:hypothetical protein